MENCLVFAFGLTCIYPDNSSPECRQSLPKRVIERTSQPNYVGLFFDLFYKFPSLNIETCSNLPKKKVTYVMNVSFLAKKHSKIRICACRAFFRPPVFYYCHPLSISAYYDDFRKQKASHFCEAFYLLGNFFTSFFISK